MNIVAIDTETTGVDFNHGAKPFFVTVCNQDHEVTYFDWLVNPKTRQPYVKKSDLEDLEDIIASADMLVLHNAKFDVKALDTVRKNKYWPWDKTWCTLIGSHLVRSNEMHNLTALSMKYLGIDIYTKEEAIDVAAKKARTIADKLGWAIAKEGRPDMPSAKEKLHKFDMWLPKRVALHYPGEFPDWLTVLEEYANVDSQVTLELQRVQEQIFSEEGLHPIFDKRMEVVPVAYKMETTGMGISTKRSRQLIKEYEEESERLGRICTNIAKKVHGYELELPKGSKNKSLETFIFDVLKSPIVGTTKSGNPSMDKTALEQWALDASPRSTSWRFYNALKDKRSRDTALSYLHSYNRFMVPDLQDNWFGTLYPSLNPTGTWTLRWSSNNPNEQNISKKKGFNLRYAFGPRKGRAWASLDYDNLELRIPAYECGEPAMLELFENPTAPPYFGSYHLLIFSILHPEMWAKHGKDVATLFKATWYQWTKNGNFAELYGAVDTHDGNSTADKAFKIPGAQAIVASKLTKKAALNQSYIDLALSNGFVETLPDRTVDPNKGYPLWCDRSAKFGKGVSPTVPLNYHVQGTACWVIMRAMIEVQAYLDKINEKLHPKDHWHIALQVHDELDIDFPLRGNWRKHLYNIRAIMASIGDDVNVKLPCGCDIHPDNWSTGIPIETFALAS